MNLGQGTVERISRGTARRQTLSWKRKKHGEGPDSETPDLSSSMGARPKLETFLICDGPVDPTVFKKLTFRNGNCRAGCEDQILWCVCGPVQVEVRNQTHRWQ